MSAAQRASPKGNVAAERLSAIDPVNHDSDDLAKIVPRTITLNASEFRAAAQLLHVLVGVEVDRGRELTTIVEKGGVTSGHPNHRLLVEQARKTFANRAQRSRFFSSAMFGEAAWDMLLALYVTEMSGARHTVSGLTNLSGVPPTTALRWLDFLEQEQLVARRPNPLDGRVFFVEITDKAREALDTYFSETAAT
jgi:DNA-binding MarR family transcriptional regulator